MVFFKTEFLFQKIKNDNILLLNQQICNEKI